MGSTTRMDSAMVGDWLKNAIPETGEFACNLGAPAATGATLFGIFRADVVMKQVGEKIGGFQFGFLRVFREKTNEFSL